MKLWIVVCQVTDAQFEDSKYVLAEDIETAATKWKAARAAFMKMNVVGVSEPKSIELVASGSRLIV